MLGGGVVGVRAGAGVGSLGAHVTMRRGRRRLIAREEPFARQQVAAGAVAARRRACAIGARATGVSRATGGPHHVTSTTATLSGDELLVAVGRRPRPTVSGWRRSASSRASRIEVDDTLRVAGPRRGCTRSATSTGARCSRTWASTRRASPRTRSSARRRARRDGDGPLSPRVVFTDPQVAAVGHTLASAQEAGIAARAVDRRRPAPPAAASTAATRPARRASWSTTSASCSSARRSSAPRWPSCCTRRRSRSSARCRSRARARVPAFPTRSEVWLDLHVAS